MKTSIKITVASLFVLGASQAHATEVDLNITDMLATTVTTYVSQASNELEKSLKESVSFNVQAMLDSLLEATPPTDNDDINAKQVVLTAQQKSL